MELVAQTDEEFVNLVVKLGKDLVYSEQCRERIVASRSLLFDDVAPVRVLEEFLCKVVKVTQK